LGGALQVASSFIYEASSYSAFEFYIILGKKSAEVINVEDYKDKSHLHFFTIDFHPSESITRFFKFRFLLKKIEKDIKPLGVISVFGPCYWKPVAPHIMGFANGYLLYEDTYFFTVWNGWKKGGYKLKKLFHKYLLKREADWYWTETEDSKKRLSNFLFISESRITVASNNCSNFFREKEYLVFDDLPPKKCFRLLYISSYYPHKGFEIIPPVLDELRAQNISVELVLTIGKKEFNQIFSKYSNVINLGPVDPRYIPYIYEHADMVFVPTLLETFSAVYPEAMYMKKPIVTTDLPFAKDICRDAALYFNPESTEDCVNKIIQVLSDSKLAVSLINKGLNRVKEFDLPEERFGKLVKVLVDNN